MENKNLILERLNKLEENQDAVLKRLNKHNDHTLLEDHEFITILESSKQENEEITREIEDRNERKTKETSELSLLDTLVKQSLAVYYTLEELKYKQKSSNISPMVFLNSFKKIVLSLDVEDFSEYNKQDHINVIVSDIF
jgi:HD superfamily phosphohydrolase